MKKLMLGTSETWSKSHWSKQPRKPAYYIVDCRIFITYIFVISVSEYPCIDCDLKWASSSALNIHLRIDHKYQGNLLKGIDNKTVIRKGISICLQ